MKGEDPIRQLVGFPPQTLDPTEVCEVAGVDRDVGDALPLKGLGPTPLWRVTRQA